MTKKKEKSRHGLITRDENKKSLLMTLHKVCKITAEELRRVEIF